MKKRSPELRSAIANDVAKLISEQGYSHYNQALKKVAQRYQIKNQELLPDKQEIKIALQQYQQLFKPNNETLPIQRQITLNLITFLSPFKAQPTGLILDGSLGAHDVIQIFLKPEYTEQFLIWLLNQNIPYHESAAVFLFAKAKKKERPVIQIHYQGFDFDLIILDSAMHYEYPIDPMTTKRMPALSLSKAKQSW